MTENAFEVAAKLVEQIAIEEEMQGTDGYQRVVAAQSSRPDARVQENGGEEAVDFALFQDGLGQVPAGDLQLVVDGGRERAQGEDYGHDGQGSVGQVGWMSQQRDGNWAGRLLGLAWGWFWRPFQGVRAFSLGHGGGLHA